MSAVADQAAGPLPGREFPLGATVVDGGTNFAVASEVADGMVLCLFDQAGAETQIPMPDYDMRIWHVFVPGVGAGQAYGFRATGPYDPARGIRCEPAKLLLDPYAGPGRDGHVRSGGAGILGRRFRRAERRGLRGQRAAQPGGGRPPVPVPGRRPGWSAPPAQLRGFGHLRGARQRLHHAPPRGAC
jgi:hypothetical protein